MKTLPDRLWTLEDVAQFLQVKPSVVRYWARNREIPYVRLGRCIRFKQADIVNWVNGKERCTVRSDLSNLAQR